jgi:enoyl-CoA hydratase/carnithine racemase
MNQSDDAKARTDAAATAAAPNRADAGSAPLVVYEQQGHVGLIRLNDAHRHNALCTAIAGGVIEALQRSRATQARAIVIGSTQAAFCAGADIKEMLEADWLRRTSPGGAPTPLDMFEAIERDGRPVIAAVNGLALGGGVELVLACDLAIAADTARFALPETGLGVIPNTAMARLPRLIGPRAALELMWTRRRLDAREAHALGIVNHVVPLDDLLDRAVEMAGSIVAGAPPAAIAAVKRGVRKGADWPTIWRSQGMLDEAEWQEGFGAFLQKRPPDYARFWESAARDAGSADDAPAPGSAAESAAPGRSKTD